MALVESWLQKRLENYTAISTAADRTVKVFPIYAPQSEAEPFITFLRRNTQRDYNTNKQSGIVVSTFDINCWDTNYPRLKTICEQVRIAIDGYRQDTDGFHIRRSFIDDETDIPDPSDWGFEQPTYGVQFTLAVSHTETVPDYTS
jgi:hypothetical protein